LKISNFFITQKICIYSACSSLDSGELSFSLIQAAFSKDCFKNTVLLNQQNLMTMFPAHNVTSSSGFGIQY